MQTKDYLLNAKTILGQIKPLAKMYRQTLGRPLGITGEVAEYEAIRLLNLEVCSARQEGCDAIRRIVEGGINREEKIQIKGRVVLKKGAQRLGKIKLEKEWDFIVLVLLSEDFEPISVHEADRNAVQNEITRKGSKARNRGQLSVSSFKNIGHPIWLCEDNPSVMS
jgi:hypothetical protein